MDWRVYHAINTFVSHHSWVGSLFRFIETYGTYAIAIAAVALWLLARPGGDRKWKVAAGSALGAALLALIVNRVISSIWHRDRPFQTHHVAHIWGPRKTDASFPSDHSSAAFAIAIAVLLLDSFAGVLFLSLAVLIAVGRVIVGEHFPGDVLAGAVIGTVSAYVVVTFARPLIRFLVRLVERVTDPILRPLWRRGRSLAS
ncbi:MAG TPA: phosphatase PAP2 family protein [Gaiellaceae bacterium]|nr:phosphatase PAP2 family protein [Gaiellaceae bacterium]